MKKIFVVLATLLVAAAVLAACAQSSDVGSLSNTQAQTEAPKTNGAVGTILLSVNPEIEIEYDDQGLVVAVNGVNADGKALLANCTDYKGKTCAQVVTELVGKIYKSGEFELEMNGHAKNIVIKLEEGSAYPSEAFLDQVAQSVQAAVTANGSQSEALVVEQKDLDEKGRIGIEKAKEIVLAQLGLTEAEFTEKKYELDDGVYELEFTANGIEYEYEVDAYTGKILEADYERNDDWNKQDTPVQPAKVTLEQAKELVFTKLGITEADVKYAKYDLDDGKYEIEFHYNGAEHEFEVDANTGTIVETDLDDHRPSTQAITLEEAKATVFAHLGITEDQVTQAEYDYDDGKYEMEFIYNGMEYDVEVDAATGKILEIDKEYDD